MTEIRSPRLLYIKGVLFLCLGVIAAMILILEHPTSRFAALLTIAIWAFARSYYFAFYVVEHYIDRDFKYDGLLSFVRHTIHRARSKTLVGDEPPKGD
jgi:hypothetical protein